MKYIDLNRLFFYVNIIGMASKAFAYETFVILTIIILLILYHNMDKELGIFEGQTFWKTNISHKNNINGKSKEPFVASMQSSILDDFISPNTTMECTLTSDIDPVDAEWQTVQLNSTYVYSAHMDLRSTQAIVTVFGAINRDHIAEVENNLVCQIWKNGSLIYVNKATMTIIRTHHIPQ